MKKKTLFVFALAFCILFFEAGSFGAEKKTIIKSIKFKIEKDHEEVLIALNNFSIPEVQSLEGDKPRIVIDINNVASWKGHYKIPINGNFIKQIRTYLHRDTGKLRIVLDLKYSDDYIIDQTYYRKTNIYSITVR